MLPLLLLSACKTEEKQPPDKTTMPTETTSTTPSENPCDRVRTGAGGTAGILGLSVAHADIRLFGTASDFNSADAGLIAALGGADPIGSPDLEAYAAAVPEVCLLDAEGGTLAPAAVEPREGVWWVTPGTGPLEVPDDGAPVALDLRGLPAAPGLPEALATALAATAVGEVAMPAQEVRQWSGFQDQWYSSSNVYDNLQTEIPGDVVTGTRTSGTLFVVD